MMNTKIINRERLEQPELLKRAYALQKLERDAREHFHRLGGLPEPSIGQLMGLRRVVQNGGLERVIPLELVKQAAYLLGYNDQRYLQYFNNADAQNLIKVVNLYGLSGISSETFEEDIESKLWTSTRVYDCRKKTRRTYTGYRGDVYLYYEVEMAFLELHSEGKLLMEIDKPVDPEHDGSYDRFDRATELGWRSVIVGDLLDRFLSKKQEKPIIWGGL